MKVPSGPLIITTYNQKDTLKMTINVNTHQLVSKHQKVSDSERESLFKRYNIDSKSLPKINKEDPAIAHLNLKHGDVVKTERNSQTAGKTIYYRGVIDG